MNSSYTEKNQTSCVWFISEISVKTMAGMHEDEVLWRVLYTGPNITKELNNPHLTGKQKWQGNMEFLQRAWREPENKCRGIIGCLIGMAN